VRNGGRKGWAVEGWMRAVRRICVRCGGPARLGLRRGRKVCCVWQPSAQGALASAVPAQPPREGGQKLKGAGWAVVPLFGLAMGMYWIRCERGDELA